MSSPPAQHSSRWDHLHPLTQKIKQAWARALGEFGATITFAGAFPGQTETMPIAVYFALETDPDAAIALSLVLLAVSIVVLISLRDHWLRGGSAV